MPLVQRRTHGRGHGDRGLGMRSGPGRFADPLERVGVGRHHARPGRAGRLIGYEADRLAILLEPLLVAAGPPQEPGAPLVQEPGHGRVCRGVHLVDGRAREPDGPLQRAGAAGRVGGPRQQLVAVERHGGRPVPSVAVRRVPELHRGLVVAVGLGQGVPGLGGQAGLDHGGERPTWVPGRPPVMGELGPRLDAGPRRCGRQQLGVPGVVRAPLPGQDVGVHGFVEERVPELVAVRGRLGRDDVGVASLAERGIHRGTVERQHC